MKWIRMLTLIVSVLLMGFFGCGNDNPASSETITIINDLGRYTILLCINTWVGATALTTD